MNTTRRQGRRVVFIRPDTTYTVLSSVKDGDTFSVLAKDVGNDVKVASFPEVPPKMFLVHDDEVLGIAPSSLPAK